MERMEEMRMNRGKMNSIKDNVKGNSFLKQFPKKMRIPKREGTIKEDKCQK
jgi:hypothetical protein